MELENMILSEVTQTQKDMHAYYVLTDEQILVQDTMLHPIDPKK